MASLQDNNSGFVAALHKYLPITAWLPGYQRKWLAADLVAGLTVWAVMVPEAMAYAGIAGVPPLVGLYTVPIPLFVYAVLGTSRTLVVGPDTATAMISATTIAAMAPDGPEQFIVLTAGLAAIVGVVFLTLGLLRMGWIANFVPTPVMRGFIQGLVWVTIIGQVPKLLGVSGGSGNFFSKCNAIWRQHEAFEPTTAIVGGLSIALLFGLKGFNRRLPAALICVIVSILATTWLNLESRGVDIVGVVATGLPRLAIPRVTFEQCQLMLPAALAIVLLGFSETLGAANAAAERTGEALDTNQELLSHGPANFGSAISSGFVVVGSLSKTSVAMSSGARTQLASIVTGILIVLSLVFLMPLFCNLPHATLAAIVIEAMLGLVNFKYLQKLQQTQRVEFVIAMVAFLGVMTFGVLNGIGLGVALSLVLLVERVSYPRTAVLGRLSGQDAYRDITMHEEAETVPGLLIFRFDSDLIYANSAFFDSELRRVVRASSSPVRYVLIEGESIGAVDTTSLEMLSRLKTRLDKDGVTMLFAKIRDPVRSLMQDWGLEDEVGTHCFFERIADGVESVKQSAEVPDAPDDTNA